MMGEQLTPNDVKKIKEEIEYRKVVVRKKELEAVKEARAQGEMCIRDRWCLSKIWVKYVSGASCFLWWIQRRRQEHFLSICRE